MILKTGENVTLQVGTGLYFPKEMGDGVKAYQLVNNKTGVVEFEEVQLAAVWEAYIHFEATLSEIYSEIENGVAVETLAEDGEAEAAKPH